MKLVKQDEKSLTFLVGKRERDVLVALLLRYPVLATTHFFDRKPPQSRETAQDDALLQEALAEQQKASRKLLEEWLKQEGRFLETDLGYTFTLSTTEVEWMLQVLNDVRVGTWVQLGEPNGKTPPAIELTEESMHRVWALEMAGLFQHRLLEALHARE